jgi:hypothetical protein
VARDLVVGAHEPSIHVACRRVPLLAHDDVTGKPRAHSRVVGLGLAGALLGELMLFNGPVSARAGWPKVLLVHLIAFRRGVRPPLTSVAPNV